MQQVDYAEVFPFDGVWNIRFISEPMRSEVRRLFSDADALPTPYTTELTFAEVTVCLLAIPSNSRTCFVEAGR